MSKFGDFKEVIKLESIMISRNLELLKENQQFSGEWSAFSLCCSSHESKSFMPALHFL